MKRLILSACIMGCSIVLNATENADSSVLRQHLITLTKTDGFRNSENVQLLNQIAAFISGEFGKYSKNVYEQKYSIRGKVYKNVICSFGPANAKRIIVGAHYDVCGNQQGADDNGSGVAGLLELARLLSGKELKCRIDLVAYTLEEPPYYNTNGMGSFVHAKSLADSGINVYGMVSLEMIGYFKDEKHTQSYPIAPLRWIYGSRGNFITLIRKPNSGRFAAKFAKNFKQANEIRTVKFTAPKLLPGPKTPKPRLDVYLKSVIIAEMVLY